MMWWFPFGAGAWIMMALMVIFWGGLIFLIVWGIKKLTERSTPRRDYIDILKERYARGEITKEEYERLRRDLSA